MSLAKEAHDLDEYRKRFYQPDSLEDRFRVIEAISDFIQRSPLFKIFRRKKYSTWKRIKEGYDVLKEPAGEFDIRLLVLWESDWSVGHSVCVVGDKIFDGNFPKTLPFDRQGLNDCCGDGAYYCSVFSGYHFYSNMKTAQV